MRNLMDRITVQVALEHLQAALVLLDAERQHSVAAQLDHLIHELQSNMEAASGNS